MKEDKGKVRVIVFELEGNNHSIQESLRTVASAISRGGSNIITAKPNSALPVNGRGASNQKVAKQNESLFPEPPSDAGVAQTAVDPESDIEEDIDETEEEESGTPAKRKARTPDLVPDFNPMQGTPNLRDFANSKNPTKKIDRCLVIAYWAKRNGYPEIHSGHIYASYQHLGWTGYPKDWNVAFFNGMKKTWIMKGKAQGLFQITHIGEDRVNLLGSKT